MQDYPSSTISGKMPSSEAIKAITYIKSRSILLDQFFTPEGITAILPALNSGYRYETRTMKSFLNPRGLSTEQELVSLVIWIDARISIEALKILAKGLNSHPVIRLPKELSADRAIALAENLAPGISLGLPDAMESKVAVQLATALPPNTEIYLNPKMPPEIFSNPHIVVKEWRTITGGYDFLLMSDTHISPKPGELHIKLKVNINIPSNDILLYKIADVKGVQTIPWKELPRNFPKDFIHFDEITRFYSAILKITSSRGHTHPTQPGLGITSLTTVLTYNLKNVAALMESAAAVLRGDKIPDILDEAIPKLKNLYEKAAFIYRKVLEINSQHTGALVQLGILYANNQIETNKNDFDVDQVPEDHHEQAALLYRKALKTKKTNPDYPKGLIHLGILYEDGLIKEEKDDFTPGIVFTADDEKTVPQKLGNKLMVESQLQDWLAAIKKIGITIEIKHDDLDSIKIVKINHKRAEWLYKKALTPNQQYPAVWLYKQVLVVNPHYTDALFRLGKLYANNFIAPKASDFYDLHRISISNDQVEWFYQAALKVNPQHVDSLFQMGRLFEDNIKPLVRDSKFVFQPPLEFASNDELQAEEFYQAVLAVNPMHADALFHLGKLYHYGRIKEEHGDFDPQRLRKVYKEKAEWFYQKALRANPQHLDTFIALGKKPNSVQQAMIYLNTLKHTRDISLKSGAIRALAELTKRSSREQKQSLSSQDRMSVDQKSIEVKLLSSSSKSPLTFKSQQEWDQIIRDIRGSDNANKNCTLLAAALIQAAIFGTIKAAESRDAKLEDYPYEPYVVIRSSSQRVKSERNYLHYYAAYKGRHLLQAEQGLLALLPPQLRFPEEKGIMNLTGSAYKDEKNFFASYHHKDDLASELKKIAQEHGGWVIGTLAFSRVAKLEAKMAEDYLKGKIEYEMTRKKYRGPKIEAGHAMVFQYVLYELATPKGIPTLMIFEPQALNNKKIKKGYKIIYTDINHLPFINTSIPDEKFSSFDTYVSVVPFHSPSLIRGILPENKSIKTEFSSPEEKKTQSSQTEISLSSGCDLVLMSISTEQKINVQKIKEFLTENKGLIGKPVLIKQGNKFVLYGLSEQGEWKLAYGLDAGKFKNLKFADSLNTLDGNEEKLILRLSKITARKDDLLRQQEKQRHSRIEKELKIRFEQIANIERQLATDQKLPSIDSSKKNFNLTPIKTKGGGDCALHAILGEWKESEGQLICPNIKEKREKIRTAITNKDNKSDMKDLIESGIKELVMSGRNDIGKSTQELRKQYRQFLDDQKELSSQSWLQFEAILRQPQNQVILDYIQKKHRIDKTTSSLHDQFYDALNQNNGELYGRILSLPLLHEAFQEYNQLQNTQFDWSGIISENIKKEYADFVGTPHNWLLPSELAIIAHVFHVTVVYYPSPNSFPLSLNPGEQSTVEVQFNGIDHFERLECSYYKDLIILSKYEIPKEVYEEIASKKGHTLSSSSSSSSSSYSPRITPSQSHKRKIRDGDLTLTTTSVTKAPHAVMFPPSTTRIRTPLQKKSKETEKFEINTTPRHIRK